MNLNVALNGRPWKIAIEAGERSGEVIVVVNGKTRVLNASWIDGDTLSLIEGSSVREVRFDRRKDDLSVGFDGNVFEAVTKRGRVHVSDPGSGKHAPDPFLGIHAIKAPMPGRIVRVLVAVGDRVAARQGLVIVEAMKMENELRSTKDGVVREVNVRQGAAIEAGAVLVTIE
jgi:biotin carboxyl carrier protein